MPRGGRRPGAGAPRGNLNALRTGARSKQVKTVMLALLIVPETRRVLLHFRRMEERRRLELTDAMNDYALLATRMRASKVRGRLAARIAAWLREVERSTAPPERARACPRAERRERSIKPNEASTDSEERTFFRDNHSSADGAAAGGKG